MFNVKSISEKFLNSYGWGIQDTEDYLDRTIRPGEFVWFYDDEMDAWSYGIYEGWFTDFNKAQETSPFFNEAYDGIDRLVITDSVINPDGTLTTRRNYALPENVYEGFSGQSNTFDLLAA
jgi:hypothetical protein